MSNVESVLSCLKDIEECAGFTEIRGRLTKDVASEAISVIKEQRETISILSFELMNNSCNTCRKRDCEYRPPLGEQVRTNCMFYI